MHTAVDLPTMNKLRKIYREFDFGNGTVRGHNYKIGQTLEKDLRDLAKQRDASIRGIDRKIQATKASIARKTSREKITSAQIHRDQDNTSCPDDIHFTEIPEKTEQITNALFVEELQAQKYGNTKKLSHNALLSPRLHHACPSSRRPLQKHLSLPAIPTVSPQETPEISRRVTSPWPCGQRPQLTHRRSHHSNSSEKLEVRLPRARSSEGLQGYSLVKISPQSERRTTLRHAQSQDILRMNEEDNQSHSEHSSNALDIPRTSPVNLPTLMRSRALSLVHSEDEDGDNQSNFNKLSVSPANQAPDMSSLEDRVGKFLKSLEDDKNQSTQLLNRGKINSGLSGQEDFQ